VWLSLVTFSRSASPTGKGGLPLVDISMIRFGLVWYGLVWFRWVGFGVVKFGYL
jgi:hypothetical protein